MKKPALEKETAGVFQRSKPCEMKLMGNIFQDKPQENKTWRRTMQYHSSWQIGITGYKQETNVLETRITRSAWIRSSLYNEENNHILRWCLQNVSKGLYGMVLAITKVHRKIAVTECGVRCSVQLSVLTGCMKNSSLTVLRDLNILEGSFFSHDCKACLAATGQIEHLFWAEHVINKNFAEKWKYREKLGCVEATEELGKDESVWEQL